MKKILLFASFLLLLTMSGCNIYTQYKQPDLAVVDSLYQRLPIDTTVISVDNTSIGFMSWRAVFTDTLLQNWIDYGLAHNTDMKIAQLRVEQAEATLLASQLAFVPNVSLSAQGGLSQYTGSQLNKSYNIAVTADWELDIFGKQLNAARGADAALEQTKAYKQAVQTSLIATIANSYFTLLMLDEQLEISRRTLDTWEENIRTLEALKRAGKTNEAAVLQAKANRLNVEASVLTLERRIIEQENSMSVLLGMAPVMLQRGKLNEQTFPEELSVGIPLQLLSFRPDVRQAEYALAEAFYASNAARAAFYPTISLGGSAGWTNNGATITNPSGWLLNAIGSLVQPLLNQGNNIARLKIAEAKQEEALLLFRQSLLDAGAEVNNALMQWQTARKRIEIGKKQIVNLQAAIWNTRLLMKHRSANYLEVLTAQQNLLQAELMQVSDRYEEIQGVISLFHALGGGMD